MLRHLTLTPSVVVYLSKSNSNVSRFLITKHSIAIERAASDVVGWNSENLSIKTVFQKNKRLNSN